jgi:hypothetical protein
MLARGSVITTEVIRERFGVSKAQAKRDLLNLELCSSAEALVLGSRRVELRMRDVRFHTDGQDNVRPAQP